MVCKTMNTAPDMKFQHGAGALSLPSASAQRRFEFPPRGTSVWHQRQIDMGLSLRDRSTTSVSELATLEDLA